MILIETLPLKEGQRVSLPDGVRGRASGDELADPRKLLA